MAPPFPKGLTVYVFNVGQGDHLLIEFPNGQYGVIDFYHQTSTKPNLLSTPALYFLEKRRLASPSKRIRLRFIHLTHPDLDHTKGVIEFLEWVHEHGLDLDEFWSFPGIRLADIIKQLNRALAATPNQQLEWRVRRIKDRLERLDELIGKIGCREQVINGVQHVGDIGKSVKAVAIAPLGSQVNQANQKQLEKTIKLILSDEPFRASNNIVSSILKFKYGKHTLLFGGDASRRVWEECLGFYERTKQPHGLCRSNFIKVSHHGSKNSSSVELWRKVLCEESSLAISAGRTRKPNHPDKETLKQIIRVGKKFNDQPNVVSTNMCSGCLEERGAKLKLVNWYAAPDKPNKDVQSMLRLIRAKEITPKARKGNKSPLDGSEASESGFSFPAMKFRPPEFAAYIYNFQPEGDSAELTRAVTKKKLSKTTCLFGGKSKETFPRCVLQR
jgi:beta-lactamase superfamily II metal-dependent hydrolase